MRTSSRLKGFSCLFLILSALCGACGDDSDGGGDGGRTDGGGAGDDASAGGGGGMSGGDGDGDGDGDGGGGGTGGSDSGTDAGDGGDAGPVDPGTSAFSGTKDLTFGTSGVVDTGVSGTGLGLIGVAAAPDDKVLVFASETSTLNRRVYRFGYDGVHDAAYGAAGYAAVTFQGGGGARPFGGDSFAADAEGRAYYLNSSRRFDSNVSAQVIETYVYRFDASGQLDAGFGTAGVLVINGAMLAGANVAAVYSAALEVLEGGSMLLAGYVQTTADENLGTGRRWAVIKLAANGALDTSFNDTGYVLIDSGERTDALHLLHVASDGTIYAVGHRADATGTFAAVKIAADGTRDMGYGGDGFAVFSESATSLINRIATDAQGRLVAIGRKEVETLKGHSAYVARFTGGGELDPSFGTDGVVLLDFITLPFSGQTWDDMLNRILFEGESMLVSGFIQSRISNQDELYTMARLASDGSPVAGFAFNESLGQLSTSLTYVGRVDDYRVSGGSLYVLPTPDGEQLIGIGLGNTNQIEFVRWD